MSRRLIDILPKIPQYEDIPYAADLEYPECGKMGVFECTCGQRYRFHCTVMTWIADDNEFDMYLYYKAKECTNWEEIKKQLG